jgi:RNA polymerase-binding transcription factor DksA
MAFDTGYNEETIKILLDRFEKTYKKIAYDYNTREIAVINYLKHSILKGGKPVECCLIKEISQVKSKRLKEIVYNNLKDESLNDAVSKVMYLLNEKENKKENENDKKNDNDNHNENDNDNERIDNVSYNESYHESWKCPYGRIEKDIFGECSSCKDMIKCLINEKEERIN